MKMNWNDWYEKQIAKPENKLPQRIKTMHSIYGVIENEKCGDCKFFERFHYHNKLYFKCSKTKITHGAGTDWRVNWQACGKFEIREDKTK